MANTTGSLNGVAVATTTLKLKKRLHQMNDEYDSSNNDDIKGDQISLLWCDGHTDDESFDNDILYTKTMLHDISNSVFCCSNETECLTYLTTVLKNETIILIISGALASKTLLDASKKIRRLDTIFIFCMEKQKYEFLLQHSKVASIHDKQESLKYSILKTIRAIERQTAILQMYDPIKQRLARNLDRETGSFIWLQLIKEAIQKMSARITDSNGKQTMLHQCREYYRNNEKELKNIDEFERTYSADQAITWYTKDSFIYKMINKALRTEDVEVLYTFRFYIMDLCASLVENSKLLRQYTMTASFTVYRGMKQSYEEIKRFKDSIGQLICANAFLSASRLKEVARIYAGLGNNPEANNDLESVIFEIEIDLNAEPHVVVADVSCFSYFKDEEEILFDLATVFEVQAMTYDDQVKLWTCHMKTSNKGYGIAQEYIELERTEMNKEDAGIFFGILLFKMGEYRKSIMYLNHLRKLRPDDTYILFMLGKSHGVLDENEQALDYYERAYNLSMEKDPPDLAHAALINTFAGLVYYYECNYDKSLSSYADSFHKYEILKMTEQTSFAHTLIGLGYVYVVLGFDNSALEHFQRALQIIQQQAPFDLPTLCRAYRHVAAGFCRIGDYDQALNMMKVSLEIGERIFIRKSLAFGVIFEVLGRILYKKGEYEQALTCYLDALEIDRCTISQENSHDMVLLYNYIGKIFYRNNKYNESNEQYDKALAILTAILTTDHIKTAYTLRNKSEVLLAQCDFDNAEDYLNRS
ncbi:unnamed protein product, partial [Rotaria sp. Silwood1]